jgi:hypothetical protein
MATITVSNQMEITAAQTTKELLVFQQICKKITVNLETSLNNSNSLEICLQILIMALTESNRLFLMEV